MPRPPKPDARRWNPDPVYLRRLIEAADLTQEQAARAIGVSPRQMRYYLAHKRTRRQEAPYTVQYALEQLGRP